MKVNNELDSNSENENKFTSKADVLHFLYRRLKNSKIEKFLDIHVSEWHSNQDKILKNIQNEFKNYHVVVRSSAKGEDSKEQSGAGLYESILNVDSSSKSEIIDAINTVINSYNNAGNKNPENKVLIQKQAENIQLSGVIFTRIENNGAPYYTINYDISSQTFGVTSGRVNNVLQLFRGIKELKIPEQFKTLIYAVKEIESVFHSTFLDIEFAITHTNKIIIFQVRPLTTIKNTKIPDQKVAKAINYNKNKFLKIVKPNHLSGNSSIFSDMTDWNPAEIIGNNPNLLDYSLYNYLIMQETWHQGRSDIGYCDVNPSNLMVKFGNKPYVDIRASFNSLLPNNIKKDIQQKLINFYLTKLEKNPHLHDKVEFQILFTCYDLETHSRLQKLKDNFSQEEIQLIENCLIDFTNKVISNFNQIYDSSMKNLFIMNSKRLEILSNLEKTNKEYDILLYAAEELLNDCKKLGTRPFSTMARIAFIASGLLKSIKAKEKIDSESVDSFMNSIRTPLSELRDDFTNYYNSKISKEQFLKKYGHLRPGTYDIISIRYDKENPYFDNIKYLKSTSDHESHCFNDQIDPFKNTQLNFENIGFFEFARKAISQREKLKFEFTRNLSDAIELIAEAGKVLGFTREELSNLDINFIFDSLKTHNKDELISIFRKKIKLQKTQKLIYDFLIKPPLIKSENDFEIIQHFSSKPNFVTSKSISGVLTRIENNQDIILENKIILIENADPGYDWIFTKNPAGLITKYGGVASHMSIRCAEIGLPAAIGCGEILFDKLSSATRVLLDCENEQVIILENEIFDEEMEVKKTLKSIGYIK